MKLANEDNKMETWSADLAYDPRTRVQIRSRMRHRTHRKQADGTIKTRTPRILQHLRQALQGPALDGDVDRHLLPLVSELCTEFGNQNIPSTKCIGSVEFHPFLQLDIGFSLSTGDTPTSLIDATRVCGIAPLRCQIYSTLLARASAPSVSP